MLLAPDNEKGGLWQRLRTEMHPEVQMHQMLFWKMSLASIPGGGSRGRGAGARYMQVGRGRSQEPGWEGAGEEATALWDGPVFPTLSE